MNTGALTPKNKLDALTPKNKLDALTPKNELDALTPKALANSSPRLERSDNLGTIK